LTALNQSVEKKPIARRNDLYTSKNTERRSFDLAASGKMQVALRVPVDSTFVTENRKLARVIFEQEMIEKVDAHQIMKE